MLYLIASLIHVFVAPLFQELGIIAPVLIIYYSFVYEHNFSFTQTIKKWYVWAFAIQIPVYLLLRVISGSIWGTGDYAYNFFKLPVNAIGNTIGYVGLSVIGSRFMPLYTFLRESGKTNSLLMGIVAMLVIIGSVFLIRFLLQFKNINQKQLILFSFGLFIIPLLPFLGLGNITSRYVYLSSAGILMLLFSLLQPFIEHKKDEVKKAALSLSILSILLFIGYNLAELSRINNDWQHAGTITSNAISTVSQEFITVEELPKDTEFYFVNVPIRYGEAWVFPVGLPDAMWVPFQDEKLTVKQFATIEEAKEAVTMPVTTRIFVFDNNGKLTKIPAQANNSSFYAQ